MNISDEVVEAEVNAHGAASNPKWNHPIMGYQTFSADQVDYLREQARDRLLNQRIAAIEHLVENAVTIHHRLALRDEIRKILTP